MKTTICAGLIAAAVIGLAGPTHAKGGNHLVANAGACVKGGYIDRAAGWQMGPYVWGGPAVFANGKLNRPTERADRFDGDAACPVPGPTKP